MPTRLKKPPAPPMPWLREIDRNSKILCLDVSSKAVGWAIVDGYGNLRGWDLVRVTASWEIMRRIQHLCAELHDQIDRQIKETYRLGIDLVVMEWQSHKVAARLANAQGLAGLGQAQGAVMATLHNFRGYGPVHGVSERDWTGSVKKGQRASEVAARYPQLRNWLGKPIVETKIRGEKQTVELLGYERDPGLDVCDAAGLGLWVTDQVAKKEVS